MILCDTGPIVAALNDRDRHHHRCSQLLLRHPGPLLLPSTILSEVCYLLENRAGIEAEARFLEMVEQDYLTLVSLERADLARMAALVRQYADFPLGAIDASVVAVAERLDVRDIATLDLRHFGAVRPKHLDAFRLYPN